jgi:hypothetical protein
MVVARGGGVILRSKKYARSITGGKGGRERKGEGGYMVDQRKGGEGFVSKKGREREGGGKGSGLSMRAERKKKGGRGGGGVKRGEENKGGGVG